MNQYTIPENGFVLADELKPVTIDNERAVIGAVLRGGREIFERAREIVRAEMFWSSSHRAIWQALEVMYEQGLQIDVILVGDEMDRKKSIGELEQEWGNGVWSGRALLAELRKDGDPRHVESYAEQVQNYHFKRHLLEFSGKLAGWAANGRMPKDILQDIETEMAKIQLHNIQDEYTVPLSVGVSEAYDWTDRAARGEIVGCPTGFMDVDRMLGTMINGNVYLVAGRPKRGKTAFLLSVARNVAKRREHNRVGIFSLEMSRLQVSQRLISQEAEVDLQNIIQGSLQEGDWPKYTHGVEITSNWNIIINDLSSINIGQIRQTARKIKAEGGLDLLIVDYIQLAAAENKRYERRDLEVSAVSRGLKWLARELNVPILAAAQLSRAVEQRANQKAILSDLRESGSLEQDAYAVMFLNDTDDPKIKELDLAAHRNGPIGECNLCFRASYARMDNLFNQRQIGG